MIWPAARDGHPKRVMRFRPVHPNQRAASVLQLVVAAGVLIGVLVLSGIAGQSGEIDAQLRGGQYRELSEGPRRELREERDSR